MTVMRVEPDEDDEVDGPTPLFFFLRRFLLPLALMEVDGDDEAEASVETDESMFVVC